MTRDLCPLCWPSTPNVNRGGRVYRRVWKNPYRGWYQHRAMIQWLMERSGGAIPDGMIVHHQDGNTENNLPGNLVLCPPEFNKVWRIHPYTGKFCSITEWFRMREQLNPEPDWVMSNPDPGMEAEAEYWRIDL